MINLLYFMALIVVTTVFVTIYNKKLWFLIPLLYAICGSLVIWTAPNYFGYPIPIRFVHIEEAVVINIVQSDKIYITLIEKGSKEPRLVSMELTEQNKKRANEIKKSVANGVTVVKKSSLGEADGEENLELVPITKQTIIEKDN